MNPELAVLYAKLDIYEEALKGIAKGKHWYSDYAEGDAAKDALAKATKLSQPASQPEKPKKPWVTNS